MDVDAEIHGAWEALGEGEGVVEQAIDLEREISVLVVRSPNGEVKAYPPAWNHHENQVLAWSVIPAPIPDELARQAEAIALELAETLQLEGCAGGRDVCHQSGPTSYQRARTTAA